MDEKRPKRRKDKYNPYTLSNKNGCYYLFFKDGQDVPHYYEIDKPLYDLLDSFEREDLSYLNVVDRHIEHSELTDISLNGRAFIKPIPFEDEVVNMLHTQLLHKLIAELPEIQRRRVLLYFFEGLTYEEIGKLEGCTKMPVKRSIDKAIEQLKKYFLK